MERTAPRLLIPQLQGFYQWAQPISWLLIRLTAGLMIIPHGWPKLMMGVQATAQLAPVQRGIQPDLQSVNTIARRSLDEFDFSGRAWQYRYTYSAVRFHHSQALAVCSARHRQSLRIRSKRRVDIDRNSIFIFVGLDMLVIDLRQLNRDVLKFRSSQFVDIYR